MFAYVSYRIPEISDELYKIDDAMKAGFGWEHGPFQIWDAIGVQKGIEINGIRRSLTFAMGVGYVRI